MSLLATLALGLVLAAPTEPSGSSEKPYRIETTGTTQKVKAGQKGVLRLAFLPASGFKISREAPLKIQLSATGVKLAKAALGQKDAEDAKSTAPTFAVDFDAATTGAQTIGANATFFVCNENICERKTEALTIAVEVQP